MDGTGRRDVRPEAVDKGFGFLMAGRESDRARGSAKYRELVSPYREIPGSGSDGILHHEVAEEGLSQGEVAVEASHGEEIAQ